MSSETSTIRSRAALRERIRNTPGDLLTAADAELILAEFASDLGNHERELGFIESVGKAVKLIIDDGTVTVPVVLRTCNVLFEPGTTASAFFCTPDIGEPFVVRRNRIYTWDVD